MNKVERQEWLWAQWEKLRNRVDEADAAELLEGAVDSICETFKRAESPE